MTLTDWLNIETIVNGRNGVSTPVPTAREITFLCLNPGQFVLSALIFGLSYGQAQQFYLSCGLLQNGCSMLPEEMLSGTVVCRCGNHPPICPNYNILKSLVWNLEDVSVKYIGVTTTHCS
jgi:hypothetical protein